MSIPQVIPFSSQMEGMFHPAGILKNDDKYTVTLDCVEPLNPERRFKLLGFSKGVYGLSGISKTSKLSTLVVVTPLYVQCTFNSAFPVL